MTVGASPTSISLSASPSSAAFGETESFTATIDVPNGVTAPSAGTVTFFDSGVKLGSAPVAGGVASFATTSLAVGSHTITASYSGASGYLASTTGVESTSAQSVVPTTGLSLFTAIAVDSLGDLFIVDTQSNQVIEITSSGTERAIGSGLMGPTGVAVDNQGDAFIADTGNHRVVEVTRSGTQTTVGSGLVLPAGVAVDNTGDVFISDPGTKSVVEVTATGSQSTFLGSGLVFPLGLAVDAAGDVFIADSDAGQVLEVTPTGTQKVVATGLSSPAAVAVDSAGDVFITNSGNNQVVEVTTTGKQTIISSGLSFPAGVAVDSAGDVFISDSLNSRVLKLTPGVPVTVTANVVTSPPVKTGSPTPPSGTTTTTSTSGGTSSPTSGGVPSSPIVIIGEHANFKRKLKHGKPVGNPMLSGFTIDFSSRLAAATAELASNYQIDVLSTKTIKKRKVASVQPLLNFTVSYNDAGESVTILLSNPQSFKTGGEITVLGGPARGVMGLTGAFVSGNRELVVSPGGKAIAPA